MKVMKKLRVVAAVVAVTGGAVSALGAQVLVSIGVLDPASPESAVYAISQDGTFAAGYSNGPDSGGTATIQQPVVWSAVTGLVQLPNPRDLPGQATGVVVREATADIGVGGNIENQMQTYMAPMSDPAAGAWTPNYYGPAVIIGPYNASRADIGAGSATGAWYTAGQRLLTTKRGYRRRVSPEVGADYQNVGDVSANSVSGTGRCVGWDSGNPGGAHRALFLNITNGSTQTLIPGGSGILSEAFGISVDASVLSGFDTDGSGNTQAFIWQVGDAAMTLIGTLPGDTQSCAIAVNVAKTAVGYSSDGTTERAVIWDTTGTWDATGQPKLLMDLLVAAEVDVSDWSSLTRATTMSDDGSVLGGYGVWAADGSMRGFVVRPPGPCEPLFADADKDGDVDQEDFAALQRCLTDPGVGVTPECACFNVHPGWPTPDDDVDIDDVVAFQQCASGPAIPADPDCGG